MRDGFVCMRLAEDEVHEAGLGVDYGWSGEAVLLFVSVYVSLLRRVECINTLFAQRRLLL